MVQLHKKQLVLPEVTSENASCLKGQKRRAEEDEEMVVENGAKMETDNVTAANSASCPQSKKVETEESQSKAKNQPTLTYEDIQKFSYPIKDIEGQSFILKVFLKLIFY